MSLVGRENVYHCRSCGGWIRTVDLDEGATPMFVRCRATEGCPGMMTSGGYKPEKYTEREGYPREVGWEWFRPTPHDAQRMTLDLRAHYDKGGLWLRRRTTAVQEGLDL